jgi:methyl-accepting chemotaxis protein
VGKATFAMLKSQHRAWEKRLKAYLEGKGSLSETEAFSHEDCDLGKWLYSTGMIDYGSMPEMQELEEVHVEVHSMIRKIIQLKQSGRVVSEKDFEKVEIINRKIISLLTDIELKLK